MKKDTGTGTLWPLLILFVLAGSFRVGFVTVKYSGERSWLLSYPDEEAYCMSARSLAGGGELVDEFGYRATYMPGYPAFLALFDWCAQPLFWARIVQAFLGALASPATYLLAKRWGALLKSNDSTISYSQVALLAGLAVAFDPFLIFFCGLLLTETLFTTALVFAWIFVLDLSGTDSRSRYGHAIVAGVMLSICIMLRPSAVILIIAVPVALVLYRRFDRSAVVAGALIVVVVVAGLLPWALRNRTAIGQWCWLTTRGGISLYDGLHEGATGASDLAHTKEMPEVAGKSETEWDDYFRNRALTAAGQDPLRVLRLAGCKFLRMWNLIPNVGAYRTGLITSVSAIWMLVLLLSAAVGWWRERHAVRLWVMLLLPAIGFTLLHAIFVASIRYRVPVMPMIIILSATGIVTLLQWIWPTAKASK
ncbi:MAG: hypothetical protein ACYTBZ_04950 [Planctomycetota bacterium]